MGKMTHKGPSLPKESPVREEPRPVIHWRYGDMGHQEVRMWRWGWAGDQFDVLNVADFERFRERCESMLVATFQFHREDEA